MPVANFDEDAVEHHIGVAVYSRPGCMFCAQVCELMRAAGLPHDEFDVSDRVDQGKLAARFGARSFPIVAVNGRYVGGFTHIVRLHAEGRLSSLAETKTFPPEPNEDARVEPAPPKPVGSEPGRLGDYARLGEYFSTRGRPPRPPE
jgi:glutaredoxin